LDLVVKISFGNKDYYVLKFKLIFELSWGILLAKYLNLQLSGNLMDHV
jgi:hypothetical protein